MKNILSLILSGMLGGALVLGVVKISEKPQTAVNEKVHSSDNPKAFFANQSQPLSLQSAFDFTAAAAASTPAVVHIIAQQSNEPRTEREAYLQRYFGKPSPQTATGSGVIFSRNGYIVTNNHVVEKANVIEVVLSDKRKYKANLVGRDPSTDLAVLKIEEDRLPVLEFANSDKARVGEWVIAVGNPFQLTSTVTAGIVSAKGRNINILPGQGAIESFIQTDAAVNPGNSGGALVNSRGELLGINTAIATPTGTYAGYSFAVPINLVNKVVKDLIKHGEVKRGLLGIYISNVDNDLARKYDLNVTEGIYVEQIIEDGGASDAGIVEGDVIIKVNNVKVKTVPQLQEQIGSRNPDDEVMVTVNRKGRERDIPVRLKR